MQELEKLLHTLIKMGWKPRYKNKIAIISIRADELRLLEESWSIYTPYSPRLRELVSLESWLWQFVAENCLFSRNINQRDYLVDSADSKYGALENNGYYRLMKSALVPEEELGKFLVENIKTE